jgi:hypothetical protein
MKSILAFFLDGPACREKKEKIGQSAGNDFGNKAIHNPLAGLYCRVVI